MQYFLLIPLQKYHNLQTPHVTEIILKISYVNFSLEFMKNLNF